MCSRPLCAGWIALGLVLISVLWSPYEPLSENKTVSAGLSNAALAVPTLCIRQMTWWWAQLQSHISPTRSRQIQNWANMLYDNDEPGAPSQSDNKRVFQLAFHSLQIASEAQLSPVGQLTLNRLLDYVLKARYQVYQQHLSRSDAGYAAKENDQLPPVVVITGLYRTGTTFLMKLLALDQPFVKSFTVSDLMAPVHGPNTLEHHRFAFERDLMGHTLFCNGSAFDENIQSVHDTAADQAEEEAILMFATGSFGPLAHLLDHEALQLWTLPTVDDGDYCSLMAYERELATNVMYRYIKLTLSSILKFSSASPSDSSDSSVVTERILLKSPQHTYHIYALPRHFPNAQVIIMEREPIENVVASWCSALLHMLPMLDLHHMQHFDLHRYGARVLRHLVYMDQQLKKYKENQPVNTTITVCYDDFINNPFGVVQRVYQHFNWTFSSEYQQALLSYVLARKSKPSAHGQRMRQQFSIDERLAVFGLTVGQVRAAFGHQVN